MLMNLIGNLCSNYTSEIPNTTLRPGANVLNQSESEWRIYMRQWTIGSDNVLTGTKPLSEPTLEY